MRANPISVSASYRCSGRFSKPRASGVLSAVDRHNKFFGANLIFFGYSSVLAFRHVRDSFCGQGILSQEISLPALVPKSLIFQATMRVDFEKGEPICQPMSTLTVGQQASSHGQSQSLPRQNGAPSSSSASLF